MKKGLETIPRSPIDEQSRDRRNQDAGGESPGTRARAESPPPRKVRFEKRGRRTYDLAVAFFFAFTADLVGFAVLPADFAVFVAR